MSRISPWKAWTSIFICVLGILFSLPNLLSDKSLSHLPDWFPKNRVNLGLDLQGGAHLVLRAEIETAFDERMRNLVDLLRTQLRQARIGYTDLGVTSLEDKKQAITLKLRDLDKGNTLKSVVSEVDKDLRIQISSEGGVILTYPEEVLIAHARAILEQSKEIIRRRVDETGTREPIIQRQGEDRILLQLPGIEDPEYVKTLLGQTAKLTFRMVDMSLDPDSLTSDTPVAPSLEILPGEDRQDRGTPIYYAVKRQILVSGEMLVDAQPAFDENGRATVNFKFDSAGARKFANATQENVGKVFAIILDKKVICAPVIREAITQGSGMISGNFTVQQAHELSLLLRAGALPCPLTVIEERTVGPGLGSDSIKMGKEGTLISIALVVLFMMVAYALFGFFAAFGVLFNLILLFAAMTFLQITLTLPGIAGIALTIGMAVDANVLIFERIREELRLGQRPVVAIDLGYKRAIATIVDSNLTTLIANLLLYQFGTGPVRGFAVTLSLGILISMFTAVTLTRMVVAWWLKWKKPKELAF
jgi:preprotein translocase subunit SecD